MKKLLILMTFMMLSGCMSSRGPAESALKGMEVELPVELGNKTANACSIHLLGFIGSFGDNSIGMTARRAGIRKISYYEKNYKYYVLWGESCNTVFGY